MKRLILAFVFLTFCIPVKCQISEVEIKDSTFIKAVNIFLDSVDQINFHNKVVVLVRISKLEVHQIPEPTANDAVYWSTSRINRALNYTLVLSIQESLSIFKEEMPSYFFEHRGRRCFVTFGANDFFNLKEQDRKAILKEAGKSIRKVLSSSTLARMEITVSDMRLIVGPYWHI